MTRTRLTLGVVAAATAAATLLIGGVFRDASSARPAAPSLAQPAAGPLQTGFSPSTARNYGVLGDALVELGRYRDAFRAYDTMASLRPGLGAYARVSHARELLGRVDPAIAAMKLAVDAAAGQPEATAWTHVQLGKLHWSRGSLRRAAREYRAALVAFPGYV